MFYLSTFLWGEAKKGPKRRRKSMVEADKLRGQPDIKLGRGEVTFWKNKLDYRAFFLSLPRYSRNQNPDFWRTCFCSIPFNPRPAFFGGSSFFPIVCHEIKGEIEGKWFSQLQLPVFPPVFPHRMRYFFHVRRILSASINLFGNLFQFLSPLPPFIDMGV